MSIRDYINFLKNQNLELFDEQIEYLMLDQHVENQSDAYKNRVDALTNTLNEHIPKYKGDYRDKLINRRDRLAQISIV